MPKIQYQVSLSHTERAFLTEVITTSRLSAREIRRAHTLLLADEKQQDQHIATFLHVSSQTVSSTRRTFCEVGLPAALKEKPRPGNPPKLDGKQAALLVALACSPAPTGRERWTMRLLAERLIDLQIVDETISDDTVGRVLKKTRSSLG